MFACSNAYMDIAAELVSKGAATDLVEDGGYDAMGLISSEHDKKLLQDAIAAREKKNKQLASL